jgi:hypothetical protein
VELEVEASVLVNEGGVQCVAVVFARLPTGAAQLQVGDEAFLGGVRVARLDQALARSRGPGLVAFVLEDAMEARSFQPGDRVHLDDRGVYSPPLGT